MFFLNVKRVQRGMVSLSLEETKPCGRSGLIGQRMNVLQGSSYAQLLHWGSVTGQWAWLSLSYDVTGVGCELSNDNQECSWED